jgi:hypothetical protein
VTILVGMHSLATLRNVSVKILHIFIVIYLKKIAKEHFEHNLDNIILENISNAETYWKIMKMLIKSNKGCSNIHPLQNIIQDEGLEEIVYGNDEKCKLLNKYFSFIS